MFEGIYCFSFGTPHTNSGNNKKRFPSCWFDVVKFTLQQKQFENQLGGDVINTLFSEVMKMPEVKKQISQGMNAAGNKRR